MNRQILSRIFGVLGLVLVLSAAVTMAFGNATFVYAKVALGLVGIAVYFALSSSGGVKRFFKGRAAYFGFFTAISALVVIAILGAANFVAYKKPKSWDLTRNKIFTLADDTVKTLHGLKSDVNVTVFYAQNDPVYPQLADLLKRYQGQSAKFVYKFVDPYKDPELVKKYAITEGGPRIVLAYGKNEARVKEPSEQGLTNGLVKVTREGSKKVYFTEGHGEPPLRDESQKGYSLAVKSLENEGFEVETLSLLAKPQVPDDAALVMVVGPRKAFLQPEVDALKQYSERGGKVAVFLEPEVDAGLDAFLKEWGVEADNDMVVDPNPLAKLFGGTPVSPAVQPSASHEATKDLAQVGVIMPTVRSLAKLTDAPNQATPIVLTGPTAWGETDIQSLYSKGAKYDDGEKRGPLPVMTVSEKSTAGEKTKLSDQARVLVSGDSEFFSNQYAQLLGNLDLFLNTANWLAQQEDRITIRPKGRDASRLFLSEGQVAGIRFFTIDALPVALLGLGLAVWLVRRSK